MSIDSVETSIRIATHRAERRPKLFNTPAVVPNRQAKRVAAAVGDSLDPLEKQAVETFLHNSTFNPAGKSALEQALKLPHADAVCEAPKPTTLVCSDTIHEAEQTKPQAQEQFRKPNASAPKARSRETIDIRTLFAAFGV